jgi:predicted ATP-grasp superfamily ATP-dependent carboligase
MKIGAFEVVEPVPELIDTCAISMLRPWIDVGRVGTLALTRLEQHLGATELGRLARPGTFLDFTRERPRTRIVDGQRRLSTPNSIVRFAKAEAGDRDYLFLHLREPHAMAEDYTESIVELLNHFGVTEHCRIGGMFDTQPHTRPLVVTGTLNDAHSERTKGLVSPRTGVYQGPTSIVNLVTESLEAAGVVNSSLMVHIPQYVQLDEDHTGAARLIEVLCAMYGFPVALADTARGDLQYEEIDQAVKNNPDISRFITQLEAEYDRVRSGSEADESAQLMPLSPDVEDFLREMGQRLDGGGDHDDRPSE